MSAFAGCVDFTVGRVEQLGVAFGYLICGARNKHRAGLMTPCYVPFLEFVLSIFFNEVAAHSYRIQMEGGGGSLPRQFKLVLH